MDLRELRPSFSSSFFPFSRFPNRIEQGPEKVCGKTVQSLAANEVNWGCINGSVENELDGDWFPRLSFNPRRKSFFNFCLFKIFS